MSEESLEFEELGIKTLVEGDAWIPTPHGRTLARFLKSSDLPRGKEILELGAGTAIHTILLERAGARSITATEINQEFIEVAKKNMRHNGCGGTTSYLVADWLNVEGQYDLIVTNPPFAKSGKQNRRYFIDDLILNGHKCLKPKGELLFIQSSMADITKTLERLDENGFEAKVVHEAQFPFRDYYYEDLTFIEEARQVKDGFELREGKEWETLFVVHGVLRDFTPPDFAHAVQD